MPSVKPEEYPQESCKGCSNYGSTPGLFAKTVSATLNLTALLHDSFTAHASAAVPSKIPLQESPMMPVLSSTPLKPCQSMGDGPAYQTYDLSRLPRYRPMGTRHAMERKLRKYCHLLL